MENREDIMLRQTDPLVSPAREWGCYFFSIAAMVEQELGKVFEPREILKVYSMSVKNGYLDHEFTVLLPKGILTLLGSKMRFMGKYDKAYVPTSSEKEILEFFNPSTGIVHFVLGDGKGNCFFDPWENSKTVRDGYVRSKRIFTIGVK